MTFSGIAAGGLNAKPGLNCCDQRFDDVGVGCVRAFE